MYTISTWLKYEGKANRQQLLAFGDLFKIFHNPNIPEKDQLTVEITFAESKCTTSFFVPPEVWSHIIVSVAGQQMATVYLDGHNVVSPASLHCSYHDTLANAEALFYAGGLGDVSFSIDDVRLLFGAMAVSETTRSYKLLTGEKQTIFIRVKLTSKVWSDDLLQDRSSAYKSLSELVSTKIMATLQDRSEIKNIVVKGFAQGSVVADINLVYTDVHYQDILLLEEALYVNNTFDGLDVDGVEINSSSVPIYGPSISVYAINSTTLWVNWTHVSSFELNGIFQGYKLLYRETENSSYSQYNETIIYGNHTEILLTELQHFVNYTMRILAFTLSGDGLISESVTVVTPDGEVTVCPNVSAVNISSTVIYANWTTLPNASMTYKNLLGYYVFYWNASDLNSVLNFTTFKDHFLYENLEKWTVYCFNVSGYTNSGIGPACQTQCTRTFEDAPEEPPSNGTVVDITKSSVEIQWSPPPASSVPGIIRYYNFSYRVLNYSDPEPISLTTSGSPTVYKLENLAHAYVLLEINISAFTVATGPVYTMYVLTEEGVPLVAPGNTSLLNVSSTAIDANWTGLARPLDHGGVLLGYRIFIWNQSEGNESSYNTTVSTATQLVHLDGLERWRVYCSQIAAFTRIGDGPRSPVLCTRTFEDAPEEPPSNVAIVRTTWSTIELRWSPPPSYSVPGILRQYNLTYRNLNYSDERLLTLQFDSTVTSHTLENLIGLTMYEINITSVTTLPGPWSSLLVVTDEGVPGICPLNVSLYNISSTSLAMNWLAIPRRLRNGIVLGYRISIWKQSKGIDALWNITIPSVLGMRINGLQKWTTYCMRIRAFTRIGDGTLSPVECLRTSEDAPEMPPANLNVSNITWSTCHLSWDAIDSSFIPGILRSYRVTYRIIDPGFDQSNHSFLVDSRLISTDITGLQGLTNYQVMVRGVTVNDGPLQSIQLQTEEGVPTMPPVAFNTSDTTSTTFSLIWQEILATEKNGIIRGYRLTYEKEGTINQTKSLTFGSSALSAFLYHLLPFSSYKITLRGFTSKGNGVKGILRKQTSEGIPSVPPKNVYGINFTGPTSIFLGWNPLTTEELQGAIRGYQVRYTPFSVADEELINPQKEIITVVNGGLNGITLTGLSTYTTYEVSVAAMSGGGVGVRSRPLYVATCRCFKILNTNYWNYEPYTNISGMNSVSGFFPYLLDMVTLSCCQTCLEHGTSEIDYFKDGQGKPSQKSTDLEVKISVSMETDFSFPVYGYKGQTAYSRYYGFAPIVEAVGTVFLTLKPDYNSIQGGALVASIFAIVPFLSIAVIFAAIAGIIMWALECGSNQGEFSPSFTRGAPSGFWWAFITMTTVGYGDKTARTLGGRIFALIWILVGLVICSLLIGTISSAFTSVSLPALSETLVYGTQVSALQDSPDHVLGVRRNAKVNTYKEYHTLEEVQQSLLTEEVKGILIDAYVADSRKDLFAHSRLMIKKVIDLTSSYGVIMGRDSTKLRKCFRKFWKENAAAKIQFIKDHSTPVKIKEITAEEMMEDTYNPQGDQYQISLNSCFILLGILLPCGLIYEIRRRKRISSRVEPEKATASNEDLKNEEAAVTNEDLKNDVSETPIEDYPSLKRALLLKFTNEILTLAKLKRHNKLEEA